MVRIDREVLIFDQDLACLEVRRFGVEGRMDDVEGVCWIRQRAIGGGGRADDLGLIHGASSTPRPARAVVADRAPPPSRSRSACGCAGPRLRSGGGEASPPRT